MDTEGRGGEQGSRVTLARRRSYSLLDGSTFIVVNHTVRLDGLQFTAAKGGPQQRTLRSEAHLKLYCTCTTSRVIPTRRLGRAAPSRRRSRRSKVVPQCRVARNRGFDPEIAQILPPTHPIAEDGRELGCDRIVVVVQGKFSDRRVLPRGRVDLEERVLQVGERVHRGC